MSVSSDNSDRESSGSRNERAGMSDVEGDEEFESDYEYENSSDVDCCDSIFEAAHSTSLFNQEPVSCPICRDDGVEEGRALALPSCSHSFCVDCFNKYLESQIGNGNADCIMCPFILEGEDCEKVVGTRQCNSTVELEVLKEIMSNESYGRLVQMRDAAFVRKNADYHHCPTPDCTNIVLFRLISNNNNNNSENEEEGGGEEGSEVARICDCFRCGHTSCLTCGARPFHSNLTCEEHKRRERESLELYRSRAGEEARYDFDVVGGNGANGNGNDGGDGAAGGVGADNLGGALDGVKRCRRCGNGVELQSGCLKMKCLCGYRFCYACGSENAQCGCTPAHHGFTDNKTGCGDFSGLTEARSYT